MHAENSKPKILVFIYNSSNIGGPTTSMRILQNSSLKQKYQFSEIFIDERLGKLPKFKYLFQLSRRIKSMNVDIVHVSGLQLHGFYAVVAARLAGVTSIVLAVRGSTTEMISFSKLSKAIFKYIIEPITLRLSKVVYTVCDAMGRKKIIVKNTKKRFFGTVHNAAPNLSSIDFSALYVRKELGISDHEIVLVYTGRITNEKGINILLKAFSNLQLNDIRLLICGTGIDLGLYKSEYIEIINDGKLFFLGNRKDVLNVLFESDIFVFPTLHENLSNSLLEAATLGKAIVATKVGGNPEVIINGYSGILVEANNEIEFKKALEIYIDNPHLISQHGKMAKNTIETKFNQDILVEKIDEIYSSLLAETKR